jgi:hypothetical protein
MSPEVDQREACHSAGIAPAGRRIYTTIKRMSTRAFGSCARNGEPEAREARVDAPGIHQTILIEKER